MAGASAEKGFAVSLLEPASHLRDLLLNPSTPPPEIAALFDRLDTSLSIRTVRGLSGRKVQRALWRAAESNPRVTTDDLVPRDYTPMKPVVFHGKNSLPAFTEFQKICFRPRTGAAASADGGNVLWGYNETSIKGLIGPGYYVAHDTAADRLGGAAFDYRSIPPEGLPGWPEVRPNHVGLSRFIYNGTVDFMRRVAARVFIGEATRGGKELDSYFVVFRDL